MLSSTSRISTQVRMDDLLQSLSAFICEKQKKHTSLSERTKVAKTLQKGNDDSTIEKKLCRNNAKGKNK